MYSTIKKGRAAKWKMARLTTAIIKKIHLTSLPFHFADFILNEKKRKLLTIKKEKKSVMPKQAQYPMLPSVR